MTVEVASIAVAFEVPAHDGSTFTFLVSASWDGDPGWVRTHHIPGATFSETPVALRDVLRVLGDERRGEVFTAQTSVLWWLERSRRQIMGDASSTDPDIDAAQLATIEADIERLSAELEEIAEERYLIVGRSPEDSRRRPIAAEPFVREPSGPLIAPESLRDHIGHHNLDAFAHDLCDRWWLMDTADGRQLLGFEVEDPEGKHMVLTAHLSPLSWSDFRHFLALLDAVANADEVRVGFVTDAEPVLLEVEEYVRSYREPPRLVSCVIE